MAFCCARDETDHLRFSPIQTRVAKDLAAKYDMPTDVSTAVLLDADGGHVESTSVLRMFAFMGFPYNLLGPLALFLVPAFLRDFCYRVFARNRGEIWKQFRGVTGLGETQLEVYRDRIVGLEEYTGDDAGKELNPGWGFESEKKEKK